MTSSLAVDFHSEGRPGTALGAAVVGFFLITLDAVIVNVALPSIQNSLGGGIAGVQWVVAGYTLMFAVFLLPAGVLSDRIGSRRAFIAGVSLFVLTSAGCGFAPSIGALVALRFAQGVSAAMIMPSSMALVGQSYADTVRRRRALAVMAMGAGVASSCAPLLGGALSTAVSWRAIFLINVPAGLVALVLARFAAVSPRRAAPFDALGQCLAAVAMFLLTFGAIRAGESGLADPQVLGAFALAVVAAVAFVVRERQATHPVVPVSVRNRSVGACLVVGFSFVVAYYGLPFVMTLFLQQQRGLTPWEAGVVFVPMMVVGLLLTPVSPRVVERLGPRTVVVGGLLTMTIGLATLASMPASASLWLVASLMVLVGAGGPMVMPPTMALLLDSVPHHYAGSASGLFNTSRQVGGALAVAVFGAMMAGLPSLHDGVKASLAVTSVLTTATAVAVILLLPSLRRARPASTCRPLA